MSTREFEAFEAGRRYANTAYLVDLQEMQGDNLLRELVRITAQMNWQLNDLKEQIRQGNVISGQQLALTARQYYEKQLGSLEKTINRTEKMNKLPENSDQTKNVKKSLSITRIATRGIINIFVPLMETRLITNSVQHMLEQQKRRLDRFRQVNNKKAQLHLTWEEALQASHMSVDDLDRRFRRRRTVWRFCCWSLLAIALFLSGMLFAASSLPLTTLVRAISTLVLILSGVALCASRALIVTYRLWQLHERKVSEPEQGTFRDFLNDRNGWRNATLIAVTSKQY